MGWGPTGIFPTTTSEEPKPDVSARCRLNTPTWALSWKVTNAYCPSGVTATSSACFWPGMPSDPTERDPAACFRELTLKTVIPVPPVTSR